MTNSMKSMCLAAAVTGLLGGAATRIQAQPVNGHMSSTVVSSAIARRRRQYRRPEAEACLQRSERLQGARR